MLDSIRWVVLDASYVPFETRYWISFAVSLFCFSIAAYFAFEVRRAPRLFTVLALFAGALVATATSGYGARVLYSLNNPNAFILLDRVSDLASFLLVFSGAALAQEGQPEHWFLNSRRLQIGAMTLLGGLVVPRQFPLDWNAAEPASLVAGDVLALIGFLALWLGAKAVEAPLRYRAVLIALLLVEVVLNVGRDAQVLLVVPRPPQSDFFVLSFAVAKVMLTLIFCYIVVWRHEHATAGRSALDASTTREMLAAGPRPSP